MAEYKLSCTCEEVQVEMEGAPKVRGYCHCSDCRDLLSVPYHSVNAWEKQFVSISKGADSILEYQHPRLRMKKFSCRKCGDVIFNSNGMDWRVFSQISIQRSSGGVLPEELKSKSHFFYASRVVDVADDLPKRD